MSEKKLISSVAKSLFHTSFAESWQPLSFSITEEEKGTNQLMLQSIHAFFQQKVDSITIDQDSNISLDILQEMKKLGLFGISIPESYGGSGLSITSYSRIMEEIGSLDTSISALLGAHHSIGLKGLLLYGTEQQKQKYLPSLATGEKIAAFALTEPSAGSDASNLQTKAEKSADGRFYILKGNKIWITNGGIADFFTVFARTGTTEKGKPEITAFLVERAHGVQSGPAEHKLGIRGSVTNALYFEDTKVPVENVLGQVGQGFKIALSILDYGRMGLAAISLGGCKTILQLAVRHANERKAFGKFIGEFDIIRDKISHMAMNTFVLESMVYLTAKLMDQKKTDISMESAICKIFGSETVWNISDEALQIAGGAGYMQEYPYERHLRDARITLIFEGTNEVLRNFIALSGLQGPSKQMQNLQKSLHTPWSSRKEIYDFLSEKIPLFGKNKELNYLHPKLLKAKEIFLRQQKRFVFYVIKAIWKYKSALIEEQFIQFRFAEITIALYGILATLLRTHWVLEQKGEEHAIQEIEWTLLFAKHAERNLDSYFALLSKNQDQKVRDLTSKMYQVGKYPFSMWD